MKKYLILFLVVITIVSICACNKSENYRANPKAPIDLYASKETTGFLKITDSTINTLDYFDYAAEEEYMVIFEREMNTFFLEITAGRGPDVIVTNFYNPDIYDLRKMNIFFELSEIMKNDEDFNKNDYVTETIDACLFQGQQLYLPLCFRVSSLMTTGYDLSKEGLELNDYITYEDIQLLSKKYNGEDGEKYLATSPNDISNILSMYKSDLIDYTRNKANFNNPELVDLFKKYYMNFTSVPINNLNLGFEGVYPYALFMNENNSIFDALSFLSNGYEIYIYPIVNENKKINFTVDYIAGINKNAENKTGCFEYIKYLMSKENQINYRNTLTINKECMNNLISNARDTYENKEIGNCLDSFEFIYNNLSTGIVNDKIYKYVEELFNADTNSARDYNIEDSLSIVDNYVSELLNTEE